MWSQAPRFKYRLQVTSHTSPHFIVVFGTAGDEIVRRRVPHMGIASPFGKSLSLPSLSFPTAAGGP